MSLRRLLVPLCTAALAASGLAACGAGDAGSGGSAGSSGSAQDVVQQTFGAGKAIRSGKLDASLRADLKGLPLLSAPVALKVSGPFQSAGAGKVPSFDLSVGLSLAGRTLSAGAVSTGDKGFLRFQGQAYAVGDALWAKFAKGFTQASGAAGSGTSLKALGIDPLTGSRTRRSPARRTSPACPPRRSPPTSPSGRCWTTSTACSPRPAGQPAARPSCRRASPRPRARPSRTA